MTNTNLYLVPLYWQYLTTHLSSHYWGFKKSCHILKWLLLKADCFKSWQSRHAFLTFGYFYSTESKCKYLLTVHNLQSTITSQHLNLSVNSQTNVNALPIILSNHIKSRLSLINYCSQENLKSPNRLSWVCYNWSCITVSKYQDLDHL